jgi:hypothetical protein
MFPAHSRHVERQAKDAPSNWQRTLLPDPHDLELVS